MFSRSIIVALGFLSLASAARISTDGTCGSSNGRTCLGSTFGNCCSSHNWCGSTVDHCSTGCQSGYGTCNSSPQPSSQPKTVSPDGTCGGSKGYTCLNSVYGNCCSQYSYCGSSAAYCSTGCQSGFGNCNAGSSSSSTQRSTSSTSTRLSTSVRSSSSSTRSTSTRISSTTSSAQPVSTDARCGPQYGGKTCLGSQWGNCCSSHSYCGSTSDYCAPAKCQAGYGLCNTASSSLRTSTSTRSSSTSTRTASTSTTSSTMLSSSASLSSPTTFTSIASSSSTQASDTATSTVSTSIVSTSTVSTSTVSTSTVSTSTVTASTPSSTCAQQLIVDGDFENGDVVGNPWLTYNANPGDRPTHEVIADSTGSGNVYHYYGPTGDSSHIRQTLTVPAGTTVSCSFRFRTSGTFSTLRIQIYMNGVACGISTGVFPEEWTTVEGTAVTDINNPSTLVAFDYGGSGVNIYIDDVSICIMSSNTQTSIIQSTSTVDATSSSFSTVPSDLPSSTATSSGSSVTSSGGTSSTVSSSATQTSSISDVITSTPTSSVSMSSTSTSTNSAASCTLAYTAPAGATCFTVTGHGAPQIEGRLLSVLDAYASPAFGFPGYTTGIFAIDSNGYVRIVSRINNGNSMSSSTGESGYMSFNPVNDNTSNNLKAVCSLDPATRAFSCCTGSTCILTASSTYPPTDTRYQIPKFGITSSYNIPITMTYDVVSCNIC